MVDIQTAPDEACPVVSVQLRRLGSGDLAAIESHLLELDAVSRNSRFHCGFGDAAVAGYVRSLDDTVDVLFGAIESRNGRMVGLAEARPAEAPGTVELAVSVLPTHRRHGLGHELLRRAASAAFARGMTVAHLLVAPDNVAAARTAATLGARFRAPGRAVLLA